MESSLGFKNIFIPIFTFYSRNTWVPQIGQIPFYFIEMIKHLGSYSTCTRTHPGAEQSADSEHFDFSTLRLFPGAVLARAGKQSSKSPRTRLAPLFTSAPTSYITGALPPRATASDTATPAHHPKQGSNSTCSTTPPVFGHLRKPWDAQAGRGHVGPS